MKMLPPSSCGMPLVTAASCGFLRDGIEERGGEGDGQAKDVQPETQRQGRGMFHPPPRQPPTPRGRFPIDALPRESIPSPGFRRETPRRSCFPPCTVSGAIATYCPPPRKGAGGGRGSGREAGVVDCSHGKDVFGDTSGQGRGSRIRLPPPRQPLPHGGDSPIDTVPREETTTSRSHLILPEILFPPRARLSGLSPCTARPLGRGREEAAVAAGRRGCPMNTVQPETQETGEGEPYPPPPSPSAPPPRGRFSHRHSATGGDHYFAVSPDTP